ncbi:MAG: hypothetical protein SGI74_05185 [Oligoflexia bacterium]|nr:hypothetical protein [Oligoflexia bacterium]
MTDKKNKNNDEDEIDDVEEKHGGPVLDTVKKLFSVGLGAAFMTEESIRNYLSDIKLPKEVLTFVLQSAGKGKDELVQRVSKEIGALLSHVDIVKEASKFVENHKFKISAEIEVMKKDKD